MDNYIKGFVAGALVGAIAGLLLAPKPGAETRRAIEDKVEQLRQRASEAVDTVRERFQSNGDEG